ncbi:MAG: ComF family protein [Balneolaceae bacterium]|nr:MAG: ComF family protein [Balneolaceae bacterium]
MKKILKPYLDIVFPAVCVCCGASLAVSGKHLCHWCRSDRFEKADHDEFLICPDSVLFLHMMWKFDKGGYLQNLMHNLKYNFMKGVGEELGYVLGHSLIDSKESDWLQDMDQLNPLLIPVPLHKSKLRKRGYNQAGAIADGLSRAIGWSVAATDSIKRVRKTKTQTGLSTEERKKNLHGAFEVVSPTSFQNRLPVIVDDVFTTGATTYELAGILSGSDQKAGIITVAMA